MAGELDGGGIPAVSRGLSVATPPESRHMGSPRRGDSNVSLLMDIAGIHSGIPYSSEIPEVSVAGSFNHPASKGWENDQIVNSAIQPPDERSGVARRRAAAGHTTSPPPPAEDNRATPDASSN